MIEGVLIGLALVIGVPLAVFGGLVTFVAFKLLRNVGNF